MSEDANIGIKLAAIDVERLSRARLTVHWAVQPLAAAARAFADRHADDAHEALSVAPEGRFVGRKLRSHRFVALRAAALTLEIEGDDDRAAVALPLAGRTIAEALDFVRAQAGDVHEPSDTDVAIPDYDMPRHPVGDGEPFPEPDRLAIETLFTWFELAASAIGEVVSAVAPDASPLRLWPHHFDLATLEIVGPPIDEAGDERSIGLGFSPGDAGRAEPYFYVLPWPPPGKDATLRQLSVGTWEREGFVGAVLPGSEIAGRDDAHDRVTTFLREAHDAAKTAVNA